MNTVHHHICPVISIDPITINLLSVWQLSARPYYLQCISNGDACLAPSYWFVATAVQGPFQYRNTAFQYRNSHHKDKIMGISIPRKIDFILRWGPGSRLDIKMLSYQYRDSHYKDKTVSQPSHLYNGNPYTWKDHLYIEKGPWSLQCSYSYFASAM